MSRISNILSAIDESNIVHLGSSNGSRYAKNPIFKDTLKLLLKNGWRYRTRASLGNEFWEDPVSGLVISFYISGYDPAPISGTYETIRETKEWASKFYFDTVRKSKQYSLDLVRYATFLENLENFISDLNELSKTAK